MKTKTGWIAKDWELKIMRCDELVSQIQKSIQKNGKPTEGNLKRLKVIESILDCAVMNIKHGSITA